MIQRSIRPFYSVTNYEAQAFEVYSEDTHRYLSFTSARGGWCHSAPSGLESEHAIDMSPPRLQAVREVSGMGNSGSSSCGQIDQLIPVTGATFSMDHQVGSRVRRGLELKGCKCSGRMSCDDGN
jgi:hypothetical protein